MKASTHKIIAKAGCGCGGLLGVVTLIGAVVAYLQDPEFFGREFEGAPTFTPTEARAALDSLQRLDLAPLRAAPPRDHYLLPVRGKANGAETAVSVWTGAVIRPPIAFGDTFPDGNRLRQRWVAANEWDEVDSLRAAALRPWDLPAALSEDAGMPYTATEVLGTLRAVLARARTAAVRGEAAEADTLARAAITIGRGLRADNRLYHVLLGARVEAEAFRVLSAIEAQDGRRAASASTLAALARAESVAGVAERAYRFVTIAGGLAENSKALVAVAADRSVPFSVRRAALLAVGVGWVFAPGEQAIVDKERERVLAAFLEGDVPLALRPAVAAGRRLTTLPLFSRIEVVGQAQRSWTAWRRAG